MKLENKEDAVRVAVRVRPLVDRDVSLGALACVAVDEELKCIVLGKDRRFTYDTVFGTGASEELIFSDCVQPLVASCLEGFNTTVVAYGQTGSGKTHTVRGLVPLVVDEIFNGLSAPQPPQHLTLAPTPALSVSVTLLEIYNEEIRDLLNPGTPSKALALREAPGAGGVYVAGAREEGVSTPQQLLALLEHAFSARATAQTSMNDVSSRSHMVCTITLRQPKSAQASSTPGKSPVPSAPLSPCVATEDDTQLGPAWAKLQLVDLAGSERTKRSLAGVMMGSPAGSTSDASAASANARFREAININQGLLALGNVISALGDPRKAHMTHVPYRESKLTRLLQDSLGGNSRTLMLACISPSDDCLDESLSTLKYAHRARNICNRPVATRPALAAAVERDLLAHQVEVLSSQLGLVRHIVNSLPLHLAGSLEAGYSLSTVLALGHNLSTPEVCAEALSVLASLQQSLSNEPPSRVDSHPVDTGFQDEDSYCFDARAGDELPIRLSEVFRSSVSICKGMDQLSEGLPAPDDTKSLDQVQPLLQQASKLSLHGYEDEEGVLLGEMSDLEAGKPAFGALTAIDTAERSGLLAELGALAAERAALEVQCASLQEAAAQQQSDFDLVRETLEERMKLLTTSIANQEELIQALSLAEAQARQMNEACLERMAALESEINLKEQEVALLRDAIVEMEHELIAQSEEEREAVKQAAERDIAKAQDQIRALRAALQEASNQQQVMRDPNRAAAKVQSLESELKVLRSEQEVLRRRLTDRATQQERQLRSFQQEMAAVKRAANVAQQRMVALAQESRAHQAMAQVKHNEALTAQRRLRQVQAELEQARSPQHPRIKTPVDTSKIQRSTPTRDSPAARVQGSPKPTTSRGHSRQIEATASPSTPPVNKNADSKKLTMAVRTSVATNVSVMDSVVLKDLGLDLGASRLEITAALNAVPDEFKPILEQHIRAFSAHIAADRRINQLTLRQHRLHDHRTALQADRTQLLRKVSSAGRYETASGPVWDPHVPGVAPPGLAELDSKIDAADADLMYIDGVLKNMQRVIARSNTCIQELQNRMASLGAQGCASALQAVLELFIQKHMPAQDKGSSSVRSSAAWPTASTAATAIMPPAISAAKLVAAPDVEMAVNPRTSTAILPRQPSPIPASPQMPKATSPHAAITTLPQIPLACSIDQFTPAASDKALPREAAHMQQRVRHEEVSFGGSWTSSRGPSGGGGGGGGGTGVSGNIAQTGSGADVPSLVVEAGPPVCDMCDLEMSAHTASEVSAEQQSHPEIAKGDERAVAQVVQATCPCPRKPGVVVDVDASPSPSGLSTSGASMSKTPGSATSRIPHVLALDVSRVVSPRGQSLVSAAHHVRNSSLNLQQPCTPSSPHQRSLSLSSYPSLGSPAGARTPGGKPALCSPMRPGLTSPATSRLNTQ